MIRAEDLRPFLPQLDRIAADLYGVKWKGKRALCLRHPDHDPSLVYDSKRDRIFCPARECFGAKGVDVFGLVQVMDGCDFTEACKRLADHYAPHLQTGNGNGSADPPARSRAKNGPSTQKQNQVRKPPTADTIRKSQEADGWRVAAVYNYGPDVQKVRFEHTSKLQKDKGRPEKTCRWEYLDGSVWRSSKGGRTNLVYLNSIARQQDQLETLLMAEGENKADEADKIGIAAGSLKELTAENASQLAGVDIILWRDKDTEGKELEQRGVEFLRPHVRSIRAIEPPEELPDAGDIVDAVQLGWNADRIRGLMASATEIFRAEEKPAVIVTTVEQDRSQVAPPPPGWPKPLECLYGIAGKIVLALAPHTEADPMALYVQLIVAFGNMVGHSAHFIVDGANHFMNLFAVIVGQSSRGRKGTSLNHIKSLLGIIDEDWKKNRIESGLSSGEGLMMAVRDEGNIDKRLLCVESEFATILKNLERQGNILSVILRQAWDGDVLQSLTRNTAVKATGAHISTIGHITGEELRRYLTATEQANGFANRFLWVCARRSKLLPLGGKTTRDLHAEIAELKRVAEVAKQVTAMQFDEAAKKLWFENYPELTSDRLGLLGAVSSRSEAQTLRLACLFALLDGSTGLISAVHLEAALQLWRYCFDSARFIFGESSGDQIADRIWIELQQRQDTTPPGLLQDEIGSAVFGGNIHADKIQRALKALEGHGLIVCKEEKTGKPGRPGRRWICKYRKGRF